MAIFTFIGSSSDSITTRRGEVKSAVRLFYTTALQNGNGQYGASKVIAADRIADIGMPELGCSYEVEFNQWGNIAKLTKVDGPFK